MDRHPLDNPVWGSLQTTHAHLSLGDESLKMYPQDVAPFAAVASEGRRLAARSLSRLLPNDAHVYFVGYLPRVELPWLLEQGADLVQMTCPRLIPSSASGEFRELGSSDVAAMLGLTDRVFPGYFRTGTVRMGRYFGVLDGTALAAMTGERLALTGYREVSAVCTDPAYTGRGLASALVSHVAASILAEGELPFLHVSHDNQRARAVYERLGFTQRGRVPMAQLRRST